MSSVILTGDTSGTLTVSAPLVAGTNTLTLAAATGTLSPLVSATAQASTSGTSIDFTGIPSYAKRITVMFNGVSTSGTANPLVRIGSGSIQSTGYVSAGFVVATTSAAQNSSTAGFLLNQITGATASANGIMILTNISGNIWICSANVSNGTSGSGGASGSVTLSGVLDRLSITTSNGTDTFDAGSINIMYEG